MKIDSIKIHIEQELVEENINLRIKLEEAKLLIKSLQEKCDLLENCVLAYELEFKTIIENLGE